MGKKIKFPRRRYAVPPNMVIPDKRFKELEEMLDREARDNPKLRKLLTSHHITHSMASDDCPYPELW